MLCHVLTLFSVFLEELLNGPQSCLTIEIFDFLFDDFCLFCLHLIDYVLLQQFAVNISGQLCVVFGKLSDGLEETLHLEAERDNCLKVVPPT